MVKTIKNTKKTQQFSADIIIVVIIVLFGGLFLVLNKINEADKTNLEDVYKQATTTSNLIVNDLKKKGVIDNQNNVEVDLLLALDEAKLKEELGIKGDFAIVFEKNGNLVKIDAENGVNCVGSSKIVVNGVACS